MPAKKKTAPSRSRTTTSRKKAVKSNNNNIVIALLAVVVVGLFGLVWLIRSNAANPVPVANNYAVQRFPGDPNPKNSGKRYWGSSIGGNGSPSRHEGPTGKSLSVRRTFQSSWNSRLKMVDIAKDDIAHNRLPYVSTKTPGWAAMASGKYDAEIDDMLRKLDAVGGPVWLTIHHEPEGGGGSGNKPDDAGGPTAWRNMQKKIRQRMDAVGTKNIAFMPTLMAYTWDPSSGRNPEDWWVDGIWDAYMVDYYVNNGGGSATPGTTKNWNNFVAWAEKKKSRTGEIGIPFGTGEWGDYNSGSGTENRMRSFWEWSFKNNKDMIAYTYFDSNLNGGKFISGAQLATFQDILKNDPRVQRIDELGKSTSAASVSINLKNGQTISGKYNVSVTIPAGVDVASVNFRVNDIWQYADNSSPFAWTWDTTKFNNGSYSLIVRTRDSAGNPKDLTYTVNIKN